MGEIILKVPKKKKNLQVIKQKAILDNIIVERQNKYKQDIDLPTPINQAKINEDIINLAIDDTYNQTIIDKEVINNETDILNDLYYSTDNISDKFEQINEETADELIKESIDEEINIDNESQDNYEQKTIYTEIYSISDSAPIKINSIIESKQAIDVKIVQEYVQDAYDKGFKDAHNMAMFSAQERINLANNKIQQIDTLMLNINKNYQKQIIKINQEILDLSITIAETIMQKEIATDNNIFINQIKKCLDELKENTITNIIINPVDYETLKEAIKELTNNNKTLLNAKISTSQNIKKGSVIVQSDAGTIDATIDTQLTKIKELLTNELI